MIKYITPDFEHEFEEVVRYRDFQRMSKKEWVNLAKKGSVVSYSEIKNKLGNVDLEFDKLEKEKKENFNKHYKEGKIELPIVIKFKENDYDLLGGNTRIAGLLKNKINPKLWVIDMKENKKETKINESQDGIDVITMDVPLFIRMLEYAKEDAKTDMDLHTATEKALKLSKKSGKLTMSNYNTIVTVQKETNEMDAGSSGSFEAPAVGGEVIKRPLSREQDIDEVTDSSSSGAFDVPAFGKNTKGGRKDPLALGGEKTIKQSRAVTDKNFPKWGGPGGKFVEINPACKTFPYCNQGEKRAVTFYESQELSDVVKDISNKMGVPYKEVKKIVLNEIKRIFI